VESLNFVDVNIKNEYQLNMAKAGKQPEPKEDTPVEESPGDREHP
jgi:hypothetical protein